MERETGLIYTCIYIWLLFQGLRPLSVSNFPSCHFTLEILFWTVQSENLFCTKMHVTACWFVWPLCDQVTGTHRQLPVRLLRPAHCWLCVWSLCVNERDRGEWR